MAEGIKYDQHKPPMDLITPEFMEQLAHVLGFGASKYGRHNWRSGISTSRLISAAYRHLTAVNGGEDKDGESGLDHCAHAAANLMFLQWMLKNRPDLDDRFKNDNVK